MSEKMKNALKVIAFLAVTAVVLARVYHALSWKDNMGEYTSSMKQLYATPEDTIDLVFVGTSHVYCGVLPEILWRDYGYSAFNMAFSGTDASGSYHGLVELLKTQHPEVVVLDLYTLTFEKQGVETNVYRKMLGMKTSRNSVSMVWEDAEPEQRLEYLFRWPIIHTRYRELQKEDFLENPVNTFCRGEGISWESGEGRDVESSARNTSPGILTDFARGWLDRFYALAEEEGFQLCLMVVPTYVGDDEQALMKAAEQYGQELGIPTYYGNLLPGDLGLDYDTDFIDPYHLSSFGGEKFTAGLGKFLTGYYSPDDHRDPEGNALPGYEVWDLDLRWYERQKTIWDNREVSAPEEYLRRLLALDDVTFAVSLEGDYIEKKDYSGICDVLGITEDEYRKGGKWVFENGECIARLENDPAAPLYTKQLSKYDTLQIRFRDDEFGGLLQNNICINRESFSNNGFYLRIVSYDTWLDKIMESRSF